MVFGRNATRRMGYTRIEPLPGGARRLAMPELDSGAIDKGSDGRGRIVRTQRADSEGVNRLSPSHKQNEEESPHTMRAE